jgi:D-sedoheptulose 7-phosphate isomerase
MNVISLTGYTGGKLKELSDVLVNVPEIETYKIQEYHLPIYHCICLALENEFFGE